MGSLLLLSPAGDVIAFSHWISHLAPYFIGIHFMSNVAELLSVIERLELSFHRQKVLLHHCRMYTITSKSRRNKVKHRHSDTWHLTLPLIQWLYATIVCSVWHSADLLHCSSCRRMQTVITERIRCYEYRSHLKAGRQWRWRLQK